MKITRKKRTIRVGITAGPLSASSHAASPRPAILRDAVFHRAAFCEMLSEALRGIKCLRHGGQYWEPLHLGRDFALYRRAPDFLDRLRLRLKHYEFCFYRTLLHGYCGPDGLLRPRTRLWRRPDGVYTQSIDAHGEEG
jgi:hypothetical protein